jgi:hypothetical protein
MNATHENPYLVTGIGIYWTALEPGVRERIRQYAFALWRQEVVVEMPEECRWPVPYKAAEGVVDEPAWWLVIINQFSFKRRPPRSIDDTEANLLIVTFSTRLDRTDFEAGYEAPYNLSASEQDSLSAQVEKTFCWTGVRQIRLIRHLEHHTSKHKFTVELVLEETADDGSYQLITTPAEFTLHTLPSTPLPRAAYDIHDWAQHQQLLNDQERRWQATELIDQLTKDLTEKLGLVHTTVPVRHSGRTFNDHVFSV